jgi:hypothetical protein
MVMKFKIAAGAVCLILTAEAHAAEAPLADLMAAEPNDGGINVTVPTGGCTKKGDFAVSTRPVTQGAARIEFKRLKPDYCKGNFPEGIKLSFTWDDLKLPAGTKLTVTNPVADQPALPKAVRKASHRKLKTLCTRSKRGKRHCKAHRHIAHKAAHHRHRSHSRHRHHIRCDY